LPALVSDTDCFDNLRNGSILLKALEGDYIVGADIDMGCGDLLKRAGRL